MKMKKISVRMRKTVIGRRNGGKRSRIGRRRECNLEGCNEAALTLAFGRVV